MNKPLVSVCCLVYNHEAYLEKCLEGILSQKIDFDLEILLHDDASTDKSPSIILDYQHRYPKCIFPILQTENQFSKGKRILPILLQKVSGKYIALCEGDDYWTDPYKLQKQVDFMEAHPECSLCFHNATVHWYDSKKKDEVYAEFDSRVYSGHELLNNWICPTASYLFRACYIDEYIALRNKYSHISFGDIPLILHYSLHGTIYGCADVMSVYGKHLGGWTHSANAEKVYKDGRAWEELRAAFKEYKDFTSTMMSKRYKYACKQSLKEKDYPVLLKAFYRGFIRQPISGLKSVFSRFKGSGRLK